MRSRTISFCLRQSIPAVSVLLLIVWAIGQILKDRSWLCGLLFYIPSPVLAAWYLLLTGVAWKQSSKRRTLCAGLLLPPLLFVLTIENQWFIAEPAAESSSSIRLIHWNLCRAVMGWPEQLAAIRELKPDVIVLSEITDDVKLDDLAGFQTLRLGGMLVACRGKMSASDSLVAGGALKAFHMNCQLEHGPLDIMIADMTSNIYISRDLYLRPFIDVLAEQHVDIAVGDLNAPRRSMALSELPAGYFHAYDKAGSGWSYTWPVPVPVIAIDHCICGPQVHALRYRLQSTMLSDHRIQVLDFEKK